MKAATTLLLMLLSLSSVAAETISPQSIDTDIPFFWNTAFQELDSKSQIILTVDELTESRQWSLTYHLIHHLHQTGWLKKVVLGSMPTDTDIVERFNTFNTAPKQGMNLAILNDLLGRHIGDMGMLALLQELHAEGIKTYPGATVSYSQAQIAFLLQYDTSEAVKARYQHIKKMLPPEGLSSLNNMLGQAHPESLAGMYYLNAQIEQDEATAFYSSEPGTLIILPTWVHASKLTGVGAVLPASNPYLHVAGVYISNSESVIYRQLLWPDQREELLKKLREKANNFHYWYVPKL